MENKRASAVLVFLVISVILISSGIIVTNEVKKSNNENNVAGTGFFSLGNEQDSSDSLSDSSGDGTKSFTFGDSGGKSSSKKSSGGGGNSEKESLITGQTPNDLIVPETNETFDNQSLSESTNIGVQFSNGQIFEENGTKYIVRDSAIYALASSEQIIFNPPLPSSICVGEIIDIPVSLGTVNLVWGIFDPGYYECILNGKKNLVFAYSLMEADALSPDDEIQYKTGIATTYDCSTLNLGYYQGIKVERKFTDIKLSDQFVATEDLGTIEVYAKVYQSDNYFNKISTPNYNVDKSPCDCIAGSCCNLSSSRPYKYKINGSQPTGYTDENYCSGTNSPTGTSYCRKGDYYCNGISAGYSYSDYIQDTCGICKYCTPGDPTCNYYSSSTVCGTGNCDYRKSVV